MKKIKTRENKQKQRDIYDLEQVFLLSGASASQPSIVNGS